MTFNEDPAFNNLMETVLDNCFQSILDELPRVLQKTTGEGQDLLPFIITCTLDTSMADKGALGVETRSHVFPEFRTDAQSRAIRAIAREAHSPQQPPVACFFVAEATAYTPDPEEVERLKAEGVTNEKLREIADQAKIKGKHLDTVILSGLAFTRKRYFHTHLLARDAEGPRRLMSTAEYEALGEEHQPLSVTVGLGDGPDDAEETHHLHVDIDNGRVHNPGADVPREFFAEISDLVVQGNDGKLKESLREMGIETPDPDPDSEVADQINRRTGLRWKGGNGDAKDTDN